MMARVAADADGNARARSDIAIVGGGLTGSALAVALSATGARRHSVALIERRADEPRAADDPRGIALSRGGVALLRRWGLWDVLAEHAWPLWRVHVSQARGPGLTLDRGALGWDALGCVIEYAALRDALRERAKSAARWIAADCTGAAFHADSVRLQLRGSVDQGADFELDAALLAVADGHPSAMRERLGIATRDAHAHWEPEALGALIATLALPANGIAHTAHERFLSDGGVVALLPLAPDERGARAKLVWTQAEAQVTALAGLAAPRLLERIQETVGDLTGRLATDQPIAPAVYPLRAARAEEWTRSRLVLLGNAAHALYPTGAQGLNLGLRDIAALADTLGALPESRDPGELAMLDAHAHARRADHAWADGLSGALAALAARGGVTASGLLRFGIEALRCAPMARARFVQEAAGVGDVTGRWQRVAAP